MAEVSTQEKLIAEYLRHVATISTGAMLVLIYFMHNIFIYQVIKPVAAAALIGYGLAAISGGVGAMLTAFGRNSKWQETAVLAGGVGFVVATLALTVFAVFNFFVLMP